MGESSSTPFYRGVNPSRTGKGFENAGSMKQNSSSAKVRKGWTVRRRQEGIFKVAMQSLPDMKPRINHVRREEGVDVCNRKIVASCINPSLRTFHMGGKKGKGFLWDGWLKAIPRVLFLPSRYPKESCFPIPLQKADQILEHLQKEKVRQGS